MVDVDKSFNYQSQWIGDERSSHKDRVTGTVIQINKQYFVSFESGYQYKYISFFDTPMNSAIFEHFGVKFKNKKQAIEYAQKTFNRLKTVLTFRVGDISYDLYSKKYNRPCTFDENIFKGYDIKFVDTPTFCYCTDKGHEGPYQCKKFVYEDYSTTFYILTDDQINILKDQQHKDFQNTIDKILKENKQCCINYLKRYSIKYLNKICLNIIPILNVVEIKFITGVKNEESISNSRINCSND